MANEDRYEFLDGKANKYRHDYRWHKHSSARIISFLASFNSLYDE